MNALTFLCAARSTPLLSSLVLEHHHHQLFQVKQFHFAMVISFLGGIPFQNYPIIPELSVRSPWASTYCTTHAIHSFLLFHFIFLLSILQVAKNVLVFSWKWFGSETSFLFFFSFYHSLVVMFKYLKLYIFVNVRDKIV